MHRDIGVLNNFYNDDTFYTDQRRCRDCRTWQYEVGEWDRRLKRGQSAFTPLKPVAPVNVLINTPKQPPAAPPQNVSFNPMSDEPKAESKAPPPPSAPRQTPSVGPPQNEPPSKAAPPHSPYTKEHGQQLPRVPEHGQQLPKVPQPGQSQSSSSGPVPPYVANDPWGMPSTPISGAIPSVPTTTPISTSTSAEIYKNRPKVPAPDVVEKIKEKMKTTEFWAQPHQLRKLSHMQQRIVKCHPKPPGMHDVEWQLNELSQETQFVLEDVTGISWDPNDFPRKISKFKAYYRLWMMSAHPDKIKNPTAEEKKIATFKWQWTHQTITHIQNA